MSYPNPSGAETVTFQANWVNIKAANNLAPCVARSLAAMILNMQNEWLLVFLEEEFELPAAYDH